MKGVWLSAGFGVVSLILIATGAAVDGNWPLTICAPILAIAWLLNVHSAHTYGFTAGRTRRRRTYEELRAIYDARYPH